MDFVTFRDKKYNVIIKAPPINFLPTFGVIYGLLFIFSPLLYAVGQSY